MDVSNFLKESARFMAADRPDIWNEESAFHTLVDWYSKLSDDEHENGEICSGGFGLSKRSEDGLIEYELNRKITQFNIYQEEEETSVFDWTNGATVVDIGLDIPDDLQI